MPIQPTPGPKPAPAITDTPPGFAPEWLRSVLLALPSRPTPEQTNQAHHAALIWLDALRARDPGDALLAAQAVCMHLNAMDSLRQATGREMGPDLTCRLRGNATAMARVSLALVTRLLDSQGVREGGGVPDLATMRALLPETAPTPPEPAVATAPVAAATAAATASAAATQTSHGGETP